MYVCIYVRLACDPETGRIIRLSVQEDDAEVKAITTSAIAAERHELINAQDSAGSTPLHVASSAGRVAQAKLLVANRAHLSITNMDDENALQVAANSLVRKAILTLDQATSESSRCRHRLSASGSMVDLSLQGQEKREMHSDAQRACLNSTPVNMLIQSGENVNTPAGIELMTPLHNAARAGNHMVRLSVLSVLSACLFVCLFVWPVCTSMACPFARLATQPCIKVDMPAWPLTRVLASVSFIAHQSASGTQYSISPAQGATSVNI
jgi:hypothetical protein